MCGLFRRLLPSRWLLNMVDAQAVIEAWRLDCNTVSTDATVLPPARSDD